MKEFLRTIIVRLLILEAKAVVKKYRPHIVMVTGSVGKTSAKEAVYAALAPSVFVRKSEKSFNSDVGVPLTILGVPNGWSNPVAWFKNLLEGLSLILVSAPYPKWLVLEVGADRPGDITKSLAWLMPNVVVATRFPEVPVHVEYYKTPDDVFTEESAPAHWLTGTGTLVVNADDPRSKELISGNIAKKLSYGFAVDADVRAMKYLVTSKNKMPGGISFDVVYGGERTHVALKGTIGRTHAQGILAGIAAALSVGVSLQDSVKGFTDYMTPPGRTRLIPGIKESVIIDDSYNSSPVAVEEALNILASAPRRGKRIAALADMLELGSHSVSEHYRIGQLAAKSCDLLAVVGVRARDIARGALEAGMPEEQVRYFDQSQSAAQGLLADIGEGDLILVKGSQSPRMERVVKALMLDSSKAKELLVRQDSEWLSRP